MIADTSYRCFLALAVDEPVRRRLQELQGLLCRSEADLEMPRPEDLHLTLIFLGDTPVRLLPRVVDVMDGVARFHDPFHYRAEGVEAFGPPGRPRVLWGAIKPCPPLMRLQQVLAEGVARLGHVVERRAFVPHLTLARVNAIGNDRSLTSTLASITHKDIGETYVSRILLMRSDLESKTARYSILHTSPLKGIEPHAP